MSLSYVLLGWLMTAITALSAGALLFHFLKLRFSWPMIFVAGACPLSLVVTLLGLGGLVYKGVFLIVCLGTLAACVKLRAYRSIDSLQIPEKWFWIGFLPFTYLYVVNAMAPEMSADGMAYHLGLVGKYYREHALVAVPRNMYASLSQGVEMLFLFAYAFGRHSAAALVHCTYLIALPLMIADYAARKGWATAGAFAGLFVYATPVVGTDGISAYNDVALAATWFALFVVSSEYAKNRVIPAGMFLGFAYAVKYTAVVAALLLFWQWRRQWRALVGTCAVAGVFILPWVLKNWIWLENPFAPFFNAWFPNPHTNAMFEKGYSEFLRHYEVTGFQDWYTSLFLTGRHTSGFLGPMWILAPLGIFHPGAIFALLMYPLNIGCRFLIPALPFLALGIGKIVGRWRWAAAAICGVHMVLSWPTYTEHYTDNAWRIAHAPWKAALRIIPEEEFLNSALGYPVARMVEDFVPRDEPVYTFTPQAEAYTTREMFTSYYSTENQAIEKILLTPLIADYQPNLTHSIKLATPRRTIRIEQTTVNPAESWGISEIEPKPSRIRASVAAFHFERAMDGNPVTRWESGYPMAPMWVELEYDREIAEVHLWTSVNLRTAKLRVEGATVTQKELIFASPWVDWRRWASETIRGMGVRYLLVNPSNYGYQDFVDRAGDWNLEPVASRGDTTLFRIK